MNKIVTQSAGFEPARAEPNRFLVYRLNHSATTALYLLHFYQKMILHKISLKVRLQVKAVFEMNLFFLSVIGLSLTKSKKKLQQNMFLELFTEYFCTQEGRLDAGCNVLVLSLFT